MGASGPVGTRGVKQINLRECHSKETERSKIFEKGRRGRVEYKHLGCVSEPGRGSLQEEGKEGRVDAEEGEIVLRWRKADICFRVCVRA